LRLRTPVGDDRLEAACARLLAFGDLRYVTLKRVLEQGLESQPPPLPLATPTPARMFVRSAAEVLGHLFPSLFAPPTPLTPPAPPRVLEGKEGKEGKEERKESRYVPDPDGPHPRSESAAQAAAALRHPGHPGSPAPPGSRRPVVVCGVSGAPARR